MTTLAPIDISLPIDDRLVVYPGDARPAVRRLSSIAEGDPLTASELTIGCHIGTHVDAPSHFLAGGLCLSELSLAHFHGPACVLDLAEARAIDCEAVKAALDAAKPCAQHHIVLKTRNSSFLGESAYREDHSYLTPEAAAVLLGLSPLSIGFDYYSLDRTGDDDFPVHKAVARQGLPAFVCLDLRRTAPGQYYLCAFPLNAPGLDGMPVRALLFSEPPG